VVPGTAAAGLVGGVASLVKAVPVVGTVIGLAVSPTVSYAVTYAIGRVFIQHFETGGTLLNFNPDQLREHFKAEFQAAKADAPSTTEAAKAAADAAKAEGKPAATKAS
ncbi:MAG TPA: GTPase, partial [Tistrella mobilis]|nr:GTPase [Tistrella mobilis]